MSNNIEIYSVEGKLIGAFHSIINGPNDNFILNRGLIDKNLLIPDKPLRFHVIEYNWYSEKHTPYRNCMINEFKIDAYFFGSPSAAGVISLGCSYDKATIIYKLGLVDDMENFILDLEDDIKREILYKQYLASLPPKEERIRTRREQIPRRRPPFT